MKLNKIVLAVAFVASSITVAHAATTATVTFTGSVVSTTCDTSIVKDGVTKSSKIIDLGSTTVDTSAPAVEFDIASEKVGGGVCAAASTADVFWSGPAMSDMGFDNSGSASGSTMTLTAKPATGDVVITSATTQAQFTNAEMLSGMTFEAQLVGGSTVGNFSTTGTYHVVYN